MRGSEQIGSESSPISTDREKTYIQAEVIVDAFSLSELGTAPALATSTGTTGQIVIDADFIYACVDTDTWKRVAIATW